MPTYQVKCQRCGIDFSVYRGPAQPEPKYCSYACYHAGPRSTRGKVRKEVPTKRRRSVSVKVDGEIVYMLKARWVWNQHHPEDPVGPDEHIHHADHDTLNDDISNLVKLSASEHAEHHADLIGDTERSRRMRAYHKANPGRSRKGQPKICPVCGGEFYRPPSAKARTCSYVCMGKLRSMQT